jgi:hypothetical protein
MAEHGHGEHGGGHGGAHAEHGGDHGHDGGHEKKGNKESFGKMIGKQLRTIFSLTALFDLAKFVSEKFGREIALEATKGTMETGPLIIEQAVSPSGGKPAAHH